jgi:hypothetical protein
VLQYGLIDERVPRNRFVDAGIPQGRYELRKVPNQAGGAEAEFKQIREPVVVALGI